MLRPFLPRGCAVALSCAIALGACGGDDDEEALTTTTSALGPTSSTPSSTEPAATTTSTAVTTNTAPTTAQVIQVAYVAGQVVGGAQTVRARLGDTVRIELTSDAAEEMHLHTYDLVTPVVAGQLAVIEFSATIPGRHEVELEKKGRTLLVLEVR